MSLSHKIAQARYNCCNVTNIRDGACWQLCRIIERHKSVRQAPKAAPPAATSRGPPANKASGRGTQQRNAEIVTPNGIMAAVAQQQPRLVDDEADDPLDCPDYYWSDDEQ